MRKDDLNVHIYISVQKLIQSKIDCERKDFQWKKNEFMGLISEKMEVLYAEFNERAEAATSSYSVTWFFTVYLFCACD